MKLIMVVAVVLTPLLAKDNEPAKRLGEAAAVFSEVMGAPDKGIPQDLRGADKLLESKFTLGAEGSVAAGPVGRTATAQTDAQMHADILSWSRSQGLFAGIGLEGATVRPWNGSLWLLVSRIPL